MMTKGSRVELMGRIVGMWVRNKALVEGPEVVVYEGPRTELIESPVPKAEVGPVLAMVYVLTTKLPVW